MFQKTVQGLEINYAATKKKQPKCDLLRLPPSLFIELTLFIELAFQDVFWHSSVGALIYTFDMHVWMSYIFCHVALTKEQNKSNKYCARKHALLFVTSKHIYLGKQHTNIFLSVISVLHFLYLSRETAHKYLFVIYQYLTFFEKINSLWEKLQTKIV